MRLFHGSTIRVPEPRIVNRFATLDFGTGFYTTTNEEQARSFALKSYARRGREGAPIVNECSFDNALLDGNLLKVLRFDSPDASWLEFVVHNRRYGRSADVDADVIIGPVANDNVFRTIDLLESGDLTKDEAIARFKVNRLYDQHLIATPKGLNFLRYENAYEVIA